jgi:hypothetical protein
LQSKQETAQQHFFHGGCAKRAHARAQMTIYNRGVRAEMDIAGGPSPSRRGVNGLSRLLPFLARPDCYVFVIPVPRKGLPFL